MNEIFAGYEILTPITGEELKQIEKIGRVCYKSEDLITDESAETFVAGLIKRGHEAMLEHSCLSIRFICNRGVSHELVRHRLASFAQESTRYCNYSKDKFGNQISFIKPDGLWSPCDDTDERYVVWKKAMEAAEEAYFKLIELGCKPQEARDVLPNALKTEVVITANYREWRHFFKLRAARATGPAHPQMEQITVKLLKEIKERIPIVFDDIIEYGG